MEVKQPSFSFVLKGLSSQQDSGKEVPSEKSLPEFCLTTYTVGMPSPKATLEMSRILLISTLNPGIESGWQVVVSFPRIAVP